jgi:hypothetical protein
MPASDPNPDSSAESGDWLPFNPVRRDPDDSPSGKQPDGPFPTEAFHQYCNSLLADQPMDLEPDIDSDLRMCCLALRDLKSNGWGVRRNGTGVEIQKPGSTDEHKETRDEKNRKRDKKDIRDAHLALRNQQLAEPEVQAFVRRMERRHLGQHGWISIFSLMRDGLDLAKRLDAVNVLPEEKRLAALDKEIKPYIQYAEPKKRCEETGYRLTDIWRYFRYTWTMEYRGIPGRSMSFLIRDAAAPHHPVIGIASLGSVAMSLEIRDEELGWESKTFLKMLNKTSKKRHAEWLLDVLERIIDEMYKDDFFGEGILSLSQIQYPTEITVQKLKDLNTAAVEAHRRSPAREILGLANKSPDTIEDWTDVAKTDLYRSKRAKLLADMLNVRRVWQEHGFTEPTVKALRKGLKEKAFGEAVKQLVRRRQSEKAGIDLMDINICGAVAPYNHLLGGKLVAMLLCSRELGKLYESRYSAAPSIIASGMCGKPTIREPRLVALTTTSLYSIGSSQYNRIKIPASELGLSSSNFIEYKKIGFTKGFGTFHFSKATAKACDQLMADRGIKRVNHFFGEGPSPTLRKLRFGFAELGLPNGVLTKHGYRRVAYLVKLASNALEYSLGIDPEPKFFVRKKDEKKMSDLISAFWMKRWLSKRIQRPETLAAVRDHSLAYPIEHGAQVPISPSPQNDDEADLFA